MEYEFTLKFRLDPANADLEEIVNVWVLRAAPKSWQGWEWPGILDRIMGDADSAEEAILSAITDVRRAIPDARLFEVVSDFVGQTDAADLVGDLVQHPPSLDVRPAPNAPPSALLIPRPATSAPPATCIVAR